MLRNKWLFSILSIILLSLGWYRVTGLTLLVALVPLLLISDSHDSSARAFWETARWTALVLGMHHLACTWWEWEGIADAAASTACRIVLFGGVFMLYHYISKRALPALAYTTFVCGWIAAEYLCATRSFVCPLLGSGLAGDTWAVSWYAYTGVSGGTLWVLVTNLLVFRFCKTRKYSWLTGAGIAVAVPIILSLVLIWTGGQIGIIPSAGIHEIYGGMIGRTSVFIFVLCLLYYVAYRYRKRSHLVE